MRRLHRALTIAVFAALMGFPYHVRSEGQSLPRTVSDKEFWTMVVSFSEDSGSFVSDNIISNEIQFQYPIPELQKMREHGVYLGVGPEQNFTYITALRPSMAFVFDIRRGNLLLHLTYKALIEIARDRADFMSRVFARRQPAGVGFRSTARSLFDAFGSVPVSSELAVTTLRDIFDRLQRTHGFPLSGDDRRGITEVYRSLYTGGPNVRGDFGGGRWIPSYAELMAQTDLQGHDHSFMASETNFRVLKEYESHNLIVPVVGDFAGPKAIRAVGRYVKDHQATVTTFYTSNVEEYLFKGKSETGFFENVSTLPLGQDSTFIRAFFTHSDVGLRSLIDPMRPCLAAVARGEVRTYTDLITRSKTPTP